MVNAGAPYWTRLCLAFMELTMEPLWKRGIHGRAALEAFGGLLCSHHAPLSPVPFGQSSVTAQVTLHYDWLLPCGPHEIMDYIWLNTYSWDN